jgi:hypothetical protein
VVATGRSSTSSSAASGTSASSARMTSASITAVIGYARLRKHRPGSG